MLNKLLMGSLLTLVALPLLNGCSSIKSVKLKHAGIPAASPLKGYPTQHGASNKIKRIRLASGRNTRRSSIPAALPLRRIVRRAAPQRVCPTPQRRIRRVTLASAPKRSYRHSTANTQRQKQIILQQQRIAQQRTKYKQPQTSPQLNPREANKQLFSLAKHGNATQINQIISRGAQINGTNGTGETALHAAASSGNAVAAHTLIQKGANVNARTVAGWTPLHTAARFGRANIVSLLISRGAQRRSVNHDGKTPSDLAAQSNHQSIVNIIR